MGNTFSILMFCVSGAFLIYALVLAVSKNVKYIWRVDTEKIKDKKRYAIQFSKVMAVMAIAPAVSGTAGLIWNPEESRLPVILVLLVSLVICIYIGIRLTRNVK